MPLPSSGQISVSDINTELGRAPNTANSNFAGGTTPQTGSLFKLGEAGGVNQTAPHKISEWQPYPLEANFGLYGNTSLIDAEWRGTGSSNWDGLGGTSCSDDINLYSSFNQRASYAVAAFVWTTDVNPPSNNYSNAFTIYFKWNCSSNSNMKVSAMVYELNFPTSTEHGVQILVNGTTGSSNSASYNVLQRSEYTDNGTLYFYFVAEPANGTSNYSGTFNITDINVVQQC